MQSWNIKVGNGLAIDFTNSTNFAVRIRRHSDGRMERFLIASETFLAEHGYDVWVHFAMTHKMHGTDNNINVYLNGVARPDSENKGTTAHNNLIGYNGNLEIGNAKIGMQDYVGNIMMDELILYEHEMSVEDVVKLYNIYT